MKVTIEEREAAREAARAELARQELLYFVRHTFPAFVAAPHHRLICDHLEAVERGDIKRLIITMPPRHGKSQIASIHFPAWYLGRHPERQIIGASYAAQLAYSFSREARNLLENPNWPFPAVKLDSDAASVKEWKTSGGGGVYVSAGVGGPITGKGAHVAIIDDPIKNAEEAESAVYRESVWSWYTSTLRTRLMPDAAIVLILTRWHMDDLAGRLLEAAKAGGEQWTVLNLPALAEDDDPLGRPLGAPLWPAWYDLEALHATRLAVGARTFAALYQQRPVPAEGAILKGEWWRYYDPANPPRTDYTIQVWDTAFGKDQAGDYSVCGIWGRSRTGYYLLDVWRGRVEFPELKRLAQGFYTAKRPNAIVVEDAASGQSLIQELRRINLPDQTPIPVIPFKPDRDKVSRVHAISPWIEAGRVYLPENAPWLGDFLRECGEFPAGAHDDQVDMLAYALAYLTRGRPLDGDARTAVVDKPDAAPTPLANAPRAAKGALVLGRPRDDTPARVGAMVVGRKG